MDWETFRKRFIYKGWVDESERPHTMEALKIVAAKLPDNTLRGKRVAIWAHGMNTAGYAFVGSDYVFICIYPHIESMSPRFIANVIAHEFGHVVLGHPWTSRDNIEKEEREADAFAEELLK